MLAEMVSDLPVNITCKLNLDWVVTCLSLLHGTPCYLLLGNHTNQDRQDLRDLLLRHAVELAAHCYEQYH